VCFSVPGTSDTGSKNPAYINPRKYIRRYFSKRNCYIIPDTGVKGQLPHLTDEINESEKRIYDDVVRKSKPKMIEGIIINGPSEYSIKNLVLCLGKYFVSIIH